MKKLLTNSIICLSILMSYSCTSQVDDLRVSTLEDNATDAVPCLVQEEYVKIAEIEHSAKNENNQCFFNVLEKGIRGNDNTRKFMNTIRDSEGTWEIIANPVYKDYEIYKKLNGKELNVTLEEDKKFKASIDTDELERNDFVFSSKKGKHRYAKFNPKRLLFNYHLGRRNGVSMFFSICDYAYKFDVKKMFTNQNGTEIYASLVNDSNDEKIFLKKVNTNACKLLKDTKALTNIKKKMAYVGSAVEVGALVAGATAAVVFTSGIAVPAVTAPVIFGCETIVEAGVMYMICASGSH